MQIEKKVYEILENILEVEVDENTNVNMSNCQKWNSLAHIDIIMSLEEEFCILFPQNDLPNLDSQEKIIKKIKELRSDS